MSHRYAGSFLGLKSQVALINFPSPPLPPDEFFSPRPLLCVGGRCKCSAFAPCAYGDANCYKVYKCADNDAQKRCVKIRSCKEETFEVPLQLTLACNGADLRNFSTTDQRNLLRDLKTEFSALAASSCEFRPCGYKMENANDVSIVDANTLQIWVRNLAVSGGWAVGEGGGGKMCLL